MAWPGTPTLTNTYLDNSSDDPSLARDELNTAILKINLILAEITSGATVWHSGNDGTGSGLDADTTDGQHLGTSANVTFNQITGTLQTAAQPNITSLGTIASLLATLATAAQPNITSLGTLTALTVLGVTTLQNDIQHSGGWIATGGETSPDVGDGGLCLNATTNTNYLTMKGGYTHGITAIAETDTFFQCLPYQQAYGGLLIQTFIGGVSDQPFALEAHSVAAADTTKSTGGRALMEMIGYLKDSGSANRTNVGSNGNLFLINNGGATRFIFDAEGDSHQDVGTAWTNFDDEDDALAVQGLMGTLEKNSAKKNLENMVKYNAQKLHDMGVITFTPKAISSSGQDEMFLSNKGILGLYGGAIGELYGVAELMAKKLGTSYKEMRDEFRNNQLIN